tara:strand:- start:220 stop:417 length:198 start_codon:yes stop_codon:yes gene_type:complete
MLGNSLADAVVNKCAYSTVFLLLPIVIVASVAGVFDALPGLLQADNRNSFEYRGEGIVIELVPSN